LALAAASGFTRLLLCLSLSAKPTLAFCVGLRTGGKIWIA